VVNAQHTNDQSAIDLTYVRDGRVERVRGQHVVLACYNHMIPYICPEMPDLQTEAIDYATKVPLVYTNIALRNWRAFADLGYSQLYAPFGFFSSMSLDFPVSIGGYRYSTGPETPVVVHAVFVPTAPGDGRSSREQHRMGRRRLYEIPFSEFETAIYDQMAASLAGANFDPEREIAAITVNRWPHGYAYEYNELWDPPDWSPEKGPHIAGRAQIGRMSIANSDAAAYAYVNGAIDAAYRAVNEQLSI
jgi:spermidine dehydrogenase